MPKAPPRLWISNGFQFAKAVEKFKTLFIQLKLIVRLIDNSGLTPTLIDFRFVLVDSFSGALIENLFRSDQNANHLGTIS